MVKSITLTASMRSNLNSLKNISNQMGKTQERLSTGKKVNSAIDNASSYYQARALTNRASDLDALLDAMGQGIQTIQAAMEGLTSGVSFLEQASAIATEALAATKIPSKDWFESQENVAAVATNWAELKAALDSGVQGNIVIYGNIQAEGKINLKEGQNLVGVGYYGIEEPDTGKFSSIDIDLEKLNITSGITVHADNLTISDISIRGITRSSVVSYVVNLNGMSNTTLNNLDVMMDNTGQLNHGEVSNLVSIGIQLGRNTLITGNNFVYERERSEDKTVYSWGVANGTDVQLKGNLNICMLQKLSRGLANSQMSVSENSKLNIYSVVSALASSKLKLHGNSQANIVSGREGVTYGEVTLEDRSQVNMKVGTAFEGLIVDGRSYPLTINLNSTHAQMDVESSNRLFSNSNNQLTFNAISGAKFSHNGKVYKTDTDVSDNTMNLNNLPAGFAEQASYQGVNLLKNEKLDVIFNESRKNKLTVQGQDMTAEALTDVLETGADNLVLADMNEESANYLALQTRQQLATNSLSLAAQSARSVLALFG